MPPKVEATRGVVFVDGVRLGRRAVALVAPDGRYAPAGACADPRTVAPRRR